MFSFILFADSLFFSFLGLVFVKNEESSTKNYHKKSKFLNLFLVFSRFCALTLFSLNTLAIWLHSLKLLSNLKVFEHWNPVIQKNRTIFSHETLIAIEDTKPRNMKPYTEKWDRDRNLRF